MAYNNCLRVMDVYPFDCNSEQRYISGISFVYSFSEIDASCQDFIHQDINQGSLGKYIYAMKEWTSDPNEAITGFALIKNFQHPPAGFSKIDLDLNKGAGGSWNYLCIRKGEGARVTDIDVRAFGSAFKFPVYGEWQVFPRDLNSGTKIVGKYVYLMYKTE